MINRDKTQGKRKLMPRIEGTLMANKGYTGRHFVLISPREVPLCIIFSMMRTHVRYRFGNPLSDINKDIAF